ncbi:MAG: hypothetical protein K9K88_01645 [Desulfobacterales bacterium]|nr:hypothetical protein [Desulfobacterales bacterium]
MIAHKREFGLGLGMMAAFLVVLVLMFTPLFKGHNGLEYLDDLYNSISKGSAYYIPAAKEEAAQFAGNRIEVNLEMNSPEQAKQTVDLFMKSGSMVNADGSSLHVSGDLGRILENALEDADKIYYNEGQAVTAKYGGDERRVLYNWWTAFKEMEKSLKKQKKFKEAKVVDLASKKAVETAYNYYGIAPQSITDEIGVVMFSLIFYVLYTLWYGFGIMFMFEGWGMQLSH